MSLYLHKIPVPSFLEQDHLKGTRQTNSSNCQQKSFKFIFSISLSPPDLLLFPSTLSLILSFHVCCMSPCFPFLSCSTQWTRAQTVDWDITSSLERWSGWRRKSGSQQRLNKCTTSSQSVQWTRLQLCTGLLPEHKSKRDPEREERNTERNRVLPNSYNRWYSNRVLVSRAGIWIFQVTFLKIIVASFNLTLISLLRPLTERELLIKIVNLTIFNIHSLKGSVSNDILTIPAAASLIQKNSSNDWNLAQLLCVQMLITFKRSHIKCWCSSFSSNTANCNH